MIRKILRSTDPKLRIKSKPVKAVDAKIKQLITDLKDTLTVQKEPEGVGLAAPQIGKNLRVFVTNFGDFKKVVINPEVLAISKGKPKTKAKKQEASEILEGCLSLPNYYSPLTRAAKVKLKYLNEKGEEVIEEFTGFPCQIILHEVDHLEGILFLDRLLEQQKPLYELKGDQWEKVEI